eukprot:1303660-Ditylum_brightwellii.AAC.1
MVDQIIIQQLFTIFNFSLLILDINSFLVLLFRTLSSLMSLVFMLALEKVEETCKEFKGTKFD